MTKLAAFVSFTVLGLFAADPPWKSKPAAQWSEEDARHVLASSPWARTIQAGIARRLSEDELREAGQMGQPRGVGYDGVDPKGSGQKLPAGLSDVFASGGNRSPRSMAQSIALRLRWESALPVRIAELKSHEIEPPTLPGDGYRIAVFGLPGSDFKGDPQKLGAPLKDAAFLKREGKKDVKPSLVEVFARADGWAVVYLFPMSAEISERDGAVEFAAQIGRIIVAQRFDLSEMKFQGKLEL
jgi:hypothetical protein